MNHQKTNLSDFQIPFQIGRPEEMFRRRGTLVMLESENNP
jgi:hypothetical protein